MNILLINHVFTTDNKTLSIGGVEYHRQLKPNMVLKRVYPQYDFFMADHLDSVPDEVLKQTDLVIFSRSIPKGSADKLYDLNIDYALDLDDYWHLPKTHIAFEDYIKAEAPQSTEYSISIAKFVMCTTDILAEKIKPFNPNVYVMENGIDTKDEVWQPNKSYSKRLRFGFTQGNTHREDLNLIANSVVDSLNDVKFYNKAQIVLCGFYGEDTSWRNLTMEQIYEIMLTDKHKALYAYKDYLTDLLQLKKTDELNVPYVRKWGVQVNEFGNVYNDIDVSVVPLVSNDFNSCKSELKMLEASYKDCAVMVNHVAPYNILATDKNSFDLNKKSFREWSRILINNINLVADKKAQLVEDTKRYNLELLSEKRHNLYQKYKK